MSRFGALRLAACVLFLGLYVPGSASSPSSDGWIYLRNDLPVGPAERMVEILAVGDVMPGRGLTDATGLYDHVSATLQGADLAIGNLEGAVAPAADPVGETTLPLVLPLGAPLALADAGFDLLGLANNHTLDAGLTGLAETRRRLQAASIQPLDAGPAVLREIEGRTFAFLAWNDLDSADESRLLDSVHDARQEADIVLVLVHWGQEYARHPQDRQRSLASDLFEAGADIVLGSHPHVVQDVRIIDASGEQDRPRLVAYSLGNFIFDQGWDDTAQGLALRLIFDGDGLRAAQALPLWTTPRPRWMDLDDAAALLERILTAARSGFACAFDSCRSVEVPDDPRTGEFFSGSIDLTGDGVAEIVRRREAQVEVLDRGRVVWRSPAVWHVRDLALGDPNEDGRQEILLAVDKAGPSGETTSHPILVGYRGGAYRDLWGGSAVSVPILEVELADLDGDGLTELAAIEAPVDEAARYVTVWRWHGWGFGLVWRSPPGDYHDLLVLPAEVDQPVVLSASTR